MADPKHDELSEGQIEEAEQDAEDPTHEKKRDEESAPEKSGKGAARRSALSIGTGSISGI